MDKVTMTRDEAAKFIGVSPDTLTSWCRAGRISYQRKDPFQKEVTLSVYRISLPCGTEQSDQHYRRERD